MIMRGGGGTPKHTTKYQLFSVASLRFNNLNRLLDDDDTVSEESEALLPSSTLKNIREKQ